MLKRLTLLAGMLAVVLVAAVPALAQSAPEEQYEEPPEGGEPVTATGVLERPEMTTYQYGTHAITDEASGILYALQSEDEELLDGFTGERVTVSGTTDPVYDDGAVEGGPPLVNVEQIEPAAEDEEPEGEFGVRGNITEISDSTVFVEEDPSDPIDGTGSPKGYFTVTEETEILRQQGDEQVPAEFEDLRVGQLVDAEYSGPVIAIYPGQGEARSIVILENGPGDPPPGDEHPPNGNGSPGGTDPGNGNDQYADEEPPGTPEPGAPGAGAPAAGDETDGAGIGFLPDTGGTPLVLGLGALLIGGGLLARRLLG